MKIFIGADHQGYRLKEQLESYLKRRGFSVHDEGAAAPDPEDDFPVFASRVVHAMRSSDDADPRGILLCGSGQGMAIAANRFRGIRAVVVADKEEARLARNDDDSNVLALPAHIFTSTPEKAYDIVDTWLKTPYERIARRERRLKELDEL